MSCVFVINTTICCLLRMYFLVMQCAEAATPSAGCTRRRNTTVQSCRGIQQCNSRCEMLRLSMPPHWLETVVRMQCVPIAITFAICCCCAIQNDFMGRVMLSAVCAAIHYCPNHLPSEILLQNSMCRLSIMA